MNTKYDDYLLKNALHFMEHKRIIDKLESINPAPATIGTLKTLSPAELLDNNFTYVEVQKLIRCLSYYGLGLKDYCEPDFDPSTLETR